MIAIRDMKVIHIEVTNACNLICTSCTRFVGHHKKPFFMSLHDIRKSIESLDGYSGNIGLMGGEPTAHPEFKEICELFIELIPDKNKRQFWTNGFRWEKYEDIILKTFTYENIIYNEHKDEVEGVHQPLLIAAKDIIDDKEYMKELIDECWIQQRWSASITPKGAFFCEVAAAQDYLFNGSGGYAIESGWWDKDPEDFQDQVKIFCENCSAAIPMKRQNANNNKDLVSKSNLKKLEEILSPRLKKGNIILFDKKISKNEIKKNKIDWRPWEHRNFRQCGPNKYLDENGNLITEKEAEKIYNNFH